MLLRPPNVGGFVFKGNRNPAIAISFYMLDGEKKLISDAVKGRPSAFGSLYDHYHSKIYRFVLVKVSHREEAEDLTHQVFLSAWQNIATYKYRGSPFGSWLYQIARNKIIDHYRAKRPAVELENADEEYFLSSDEDLDSSIDASLNMEQVMSAIRELKPLYQDVIIMRFVEELSPKEVAAALGKTEGAVKLLQHRALKELKKLLTVKIA